MEAIDNGSNSQRQSHLQIVSIMSVPPLKVTEPRRVCQVLVSDDDTTHIIQGCCQIVLYYEKLKEDDEDHSLSLAGWIVESLARVLLDYPLLAGRLHRREVGDHDTKLEIVANDSGIRLLEAHYPMRLLEFLELNEKEHLETELVSWKEIDGHFPEFSPLTYVQVTNFECGGYSIGISCSLLLAEVLVVENFLNKWAQIHLLSQNQDTKTPVFCHTRMENHDSLSPYTISRTQIKHGVQSMVFKINYDYEDVNFGKGLWRELAVVCIEEAEEQKLDNKKMCSDFSLVVKESTEVIMVDSCSKSGYSSMQGLDLRNQILSATWDDFGVNEVAFHEGNKPVHVSCWIGSVADRCVMAIPCPQRNACVVIVVSPPL